MALRGEDLACQKAVEILDDYLEDALPPAERAVLEDHLRLCEGCTAYLEQLRTTVRLVGGLRREDVPPELMSVLLEAFRGRRAPPA
jgi:hypothetical protein